MRITLFFLTLFVGLASMAQRVKVKPEDSTYIDSIRNFEYQLEGLSYNIINANDKVERITSCYYFIQTLKKALQVPNSFDYNFESIKTVSTIRSDDEKFRVFTWNLLLDSGKYMYFGAMQMNNADSLELYGLYDSSEYNKDVYYAQFDNHHWMGGLIYQMHHYKYKKKDYYITFAWDGQDDKTNRKIVDVLWFDEEGKPNFGEEMFDFDGDLQSRIIFDFNDKAAMLLRYDKDEEAIVFANLVPINPLMKGMYENYVPDGTYDYLKFEKGIWRRYKMVFESRGKKHGNDLRRM
ncbi:MAG: hypothetical protein HOI49_01465 [Bacteroidetes bacterium]|jgi:hypothetical protein|nr:hypothetical protein [Bacteroidota bacterium]